MAKLSRKSSIFAQLVKEAGKIGGEVKLAKMLCYVEKEKGIASGFNFDKDKPHGNYTFEIKEETKHLVDEGLIEFCKEQKSGLFGKFEQHCFIATDKLKNMELPLSDKEKRAIHSIYREYSKYTRKEIEDYDHAIYRNGMVRSDAELRKYSLAETEKLIKKHAGDEESAIKELLAK